MNKDSEKLYDLMVCTCDAYEDTWLPFFTLLNTYWSCADSLRIILTTEEKDFSFSGLNIICAKTGMNWRGKSKQWGARMLASLELIESPLVLMMLDDYFISKKVYVTLLEELAAKIHGYKWDSVELIPQGDKSGIKLPEDVRLVEIDHASPYRVNTQAALWRRPSLKKLLKTHESPWEFEVRGTIRGQQSKLRFMRLINDCPETAGESIVSYPAGGGIWRGKWNPNVRSLFQNNGIEVVFSHRGFYAPPVKVQPTPRRTGLKKICRKDILSLLWQRISERWSTFRSF